MKTAVKQTILGACLLAAGFLAEPAANHAQTALPAITAAPANSSATASSAGTQEVKNPELPAPPSGEDKGMKSLEGPGGVKVPDSVKDVIKRLNTRTEDVTLDDLNNAREAVAKLDALIDIEKRLVDLDKIRQEREKANRSTLIAAVPISQLTTPRPILPPPPPPQELPQMSKEPPPLPPAAAVDVLQVEGSNNRYVALIKDGDTTHMVRAGDHLSDGSIVLSVSKLGIELQRNDKAAHLVEVKDVQSVFGANP